LDLRLGQPLFLEIQREDASDIVSRLKFSMHYDFPYQKLTVRSMIIPNTHIQPPKRQTEKKAKAARPNMPQDLVHLQRRYERLIRNRDPPSADLLLCSFCKTAIDRRVDALGVTDNISMGIACALCLLHFHDRCADDMTRVYMTDAATIDPAGTRITDHTVPNEFKNGISCCNVCVRALSLIAAMPPP